jgi:hypothetical protein
MLFIAVINVFWAVVLALASAFPHRGPLPVTSKRGADLKRAFGER